ncbi:hypothetical protein A5755_09495 [Mycolicibacterium fortuitum]|nr:hypothetical protein A5763_04940 [Mycolicibacterium fortuitum]OBB45352.1 hypothetical protein A5754_10045 [Mycolicibacterium fortuitum]OBB78762.1 hypothetical protein A5755_09495 [Mycolicibacterium fortuitum]OBF64015.1 hypothetical protein A5751_05200 [Mycolicibacterium fortuitum]OBG21117.1 hypothetical protein A5768_27710 [Mycolicibacterium fortuitum]
MRLERRSRTIYRPTATPEGSTRVDTAFTATTSFFSGTAPGNVAVADVVGQQILQGKGVCQVGDEHFSWVAALDSPPDQIALCASDFEDAGTDLAAAQ